MNVNVVDPVTIPTVTFRAATGADTNSLTPSVTIPAATQPGDLLVLITSLNAAATTVTGPAGWTLVDSGSNPTADIQTRVWSKVAGPGDAGSTVQISQAAFFKASMQVLAYRGASGISAHQIAFDTTSNVARTTPAVNVTKPGSTVVSYWSDRTTGNTGWTVPETATVRNQTVGTGGGHMTSAVADTGSVATGSAGGITANAAVASTRAVTATLVIEPDGAPNAAPTAAIVPNCQNLTCGFDGSSSTDDGGVVSWAWNYGDNTTGTGAVAPHTYASPGTYTGAVEGDRRGRPLQHRHHPGDGERRQPRRRSRSGPTPSRRATRSPRRSRSRRRSRPVTVSCSCRPRTGST